MIVSKGPAVKIEMKEETRTFPSFTAHCLNNLITVTSLHLQGLCAKNVCVCALMKRVHHTYRAHLTYLLMNSYLFS